MSLLQVVMAEGHQIHMLQDMLECSICTEEMTVARVLPCGHSFCHNCLEQCLEHLAHGGDFPCPTCRAIYKVTKAGVQAIPKNVFVNKLIDAAHDQECYVADDRLLASTSAADKVNVAYCSIEECTNTAVNYCTNCDEYMCTECDGIHSANKITKKHQTVDCDQVKQKRLPPCPTHLHMYLDLYCEACQIAICSTCVPLEHRSHKCVNIQSKMEGFQSQLDTVLSDTDRCLRVVRQAIKTTDLQSRKMQADVDVLKQQTSASYQAIIQHVKTEELKHLAEIEKGYQQIANKAAETMDKYQTAQATLESIMMYGERLKENGTVYDYITNVKGLINRCDRSVKESGRPSESKLEVNVKWGDCHIDAKGVTIDVRGANRGRVEGGDSKTITSYKTRHDYNVSGIIECHNHLIIVHGVHAVIYIYDDKMRLKSSVRVEGMTNPCGLCLVGIQEEASTKHLVVADCDGKCLWWLRVDVEAGQVTLGEPIKHYLGYLPTRVVTDSAGHALVCDRVNCRLYVYSRPVQTNTCVQLPPGMKPCVAVSDHSGGYVVSDDYKLVWVTSAGQVTRGYTDQPAVSAWDLAHDGTDLLVADSHNHCVHVVNREGRHAGHLLTQEQTRYPSRLSTNEDSKCQWLGHRGQDYKPQVIKIEYVSKPNITTVTLSATLPKLRV